MSQISFRRITASLKFLGVALKRGLRQMRTAANRPDDAAAPDFRRLLDVKVEFKNTKKTRGVLAAIALVVLAFLVSLILA